MSLVLVLLPVSEEAGAVPGTIKTAQKYMDQIEGNCSLRVLMVRPFGLLCLSVGGLLLQENARRGKKIGF